MRSGVRRFAPVSSPAAFLSDLINKSRGAGLLGTLASPFLVRTHPQIRAEVDEGRMRGTGVSRRIRSGHSRRLIADLNLSDTPAVPRLDALRNQATSALGRIIIIAAEAGGVAAPGAETANESGRYGWLKEADNCQCEHGYDRFPHCASLNSVALVKYNTMAGLFGGRDVFRGKLTVSRQSQEQSQDK